MILLTTNLLKKEFGSSNVYDVGLAINCLSNIVTPDLARELLPDLTHLTQHSHGYIRKKAVLCLFKLFMKYPQGLRLTFDRVKQCLDDSEPAVVSCAVNVITELADKNPKNYLLMAPHFFSLLTSSSNNWMLIKVVKLLGSLVSEEPRLARKLLEPLAAIVQNTQAKSLLYEAVYTLTLALPYAKKADGSVSKTVPSIVELCAEKLKDFVEEADQNLKYLGLVGFVSLMSSYPKTVVNHRNLILRCLCDDDVTIRSRALELLTGMVTRKNLQELVDQLMQHVRLSEGAYRDELIQKIIFMCSRDKYTFLTDFKWYMSILIVMSRLHGTEHGDVISSQIMNVAIRVFPVREFCVSKMVELLLQSNVVMGKSKGTIWEVLHAAAWVIGEYSNYIENVEFVSSKVGWAGSHHALLSVILAPSSLGLPPRTQAVFMQSALKIFASACNSVGTEPDHLAKCLNIFQLNLPFWMACKEVEVQERASSCFCFLTSLSFLRQVDEVQGILDVEETRIEGKCSDIISKEDAQEQQAPTTNDDLLDFVMSTTSEAPVLSVDTSSLLPSDSKSNELSSFGRIVDPSIANTCREHSKTLSTVCVPDPMKPVNSKAQKRISPPSFSGYGEPLRAGLFNNLMKADNIIPKKRKLAIEEVYFGFFGAGETKNHLTSKTPSSDENGDPSDALSQDVGGGTVLMPTGTLPASSISQDTANPSGIDRVDGTPFYLSGRGENDEILLGNGQDDDADFGEIQLGASESDDDGTRKGGSESVRSKGRKKRNKMKKKKERKTDDSISMKEDAMSIFNGSAVYQSDEEANEDELEEQRSTRFIEGGREFEGLAKVDLTTPLAPDEIMPERKHREVPEHSTEVTYRKVKKDKAKTKTKTKKRKSKKRSENDHQIGSGGEVGDLLDFGASNNYTGSVLSRVEKDREEVLSALDSLGQGLLIPLSDHNTSTKADLNLVPDVSVTLDSLSSEFSTGKWTETSTKIKIRGGGNPIRVVAEILNASIVEGSISNDGSCASLAAKSGMRGDKKLRVLIKNKGETAKLDMKSNSKKLAKSVLKRVKNVTL